MLTDLINHKADKSSVNNKKQFLFQPGLRCMGNGFILKRCEVFP